MLESASAYVQFNLHGSPRYDAGSYTGVMPLYEYQCEEDGDLITLLRTMAQADDRVEDPQDRGREFYRVHSTFQVDASSPVAQAPQMPPSGGCCCGPGGCGH